MVVPSRKLVEKTDFHSLWELLQWYPRDYFDYRPAHEPWEDGAAIKGVGRVLYKGLRGPAAIVDMVVDVSPPSEPDDGGYFDEPGDEVLSEGVQCLSTKHPLLGVRRVVSPFVCTQKQQEHSKYCCLPCATWCSAAE